jgi:uncharacterized repeat protein (TIGR03837 family)
LLSLWRCRYADAPCFPHENRPTVVNPVPAKNRIAVKCHIFCKVIDNYGDIGVCWRLARQLVAEYAVDVTIWLDDFSVLRHIASAAWGTQYPGFRGNPELVCEGVRACHWPRFEDDRDEAESPSSADIVIEAFGCRLPPSYTGMMQQHSSARPLWINLEYLSAESWAAECHGLVSQDPGTGLHKLFFFPGFVPGTGGLLRERGLVERHERWQSRQDAERARLLGDFNIPAPTGGLLVSLFTYPGEAARVWVEILASHADPVLCLVPQGRVLETLASCPGLHWSGNAGSPQVGDRARQGNLRVHVIPFLTQSDYDRLLSLCDLNLVRGEDSFVRAQWAARALLWDIYKQEEGAHMNKLCAFLDLYTRGLEREQADRVRRAWLAWNQPERLETARADFAAFLQILPQLRSHGLRWREELCQMEDLASHLMKFHEEAIVSRFFCWCRDFFDSVTPRLTPPFECLTVSE